MEFALQHADTRASSERLEALLHDDFVEVGRSGQRYGKVDIVNELLDEQSADEIWTQDYAVAELADGAALLTYRSARVNQSGELYRHAERSSIWLRAPQGWQLRFHQGTATEAFDRVSGKPR